MCSAHWSRIQQEMKKTFDIRKLQLLMWSASHNTMLPHQKHKQMVFFSQDTSHWAFFDDFHLGLMCKLKKNWCSDNPLKGACGVLTILLGHFLVTIGCWRRANKLVSRIWCNNSWSMLTIVQLLISTLSRFLCTCGPKLARFTQSGFTSLQFQKFALFQ